MAIVLILGWLFYASFPDVLFELPHSTVVNAENGQLLAAKIAADGQWRFPEVESIPPALEECILHFEDEYFYYHPGINPVSIGRALWQNISSGKTLSGGSTLSMQVIRMSRGNPPRTYSEKLVEMYLAFRMEWSYSKSEILKMYVSHAPYGGNVVGAETASWRYYHRPLDQLSWAEYATLAVLPNAPSLIRPGKNSESLLAKRNRLLKKLLINEVIDSSTYELSLLESTPEKPMPLPSSSYHLMTSLEKGGGEGKRIKTSIDSHWQNTVTQKVNTYVNYLSANGVNNACAMIVSLHDGKVKAYVGNASNPGTPSEFMDLIHAERSSGSILKPFLYAAAVEEGMLNAQTTVRDVPTTINGFTPVNFDKSYDGVVSASSALARSLNVPTAILLSEYGHVRFYEKLHELGFSTINRSADNYGLTLVLGGAEVTLWDVANAYANQAQKLISFFEGADSLSHGVSLLASAESEETTYTFDYATWWLISNALTQVQRPGLDRSWRRFSSSRKISWKTGTSFGFRDAWAVGYNSEYLVAVWVGNASGEGRPGLTGTSVAAPLMFDLFQVTGSSHWFQKPEADFRYVEVCSRTGMAPSLHCPSQKIMTSGTQNHYPLCEFHKTLQVNEKGEQVKRGCGEGEDTTWFVLDPVAAYYYQKRYLDYTPPPPFAPECQTLQEASLAILYPRNRSEIIIPTDLDGQVEKVLLEAVYSQPESVLYWHLDEEYIGSTVGRHKILANVSRGEHTLSVVDAQGVVKSVRFTGY